MYKRAGGFTLIELMITVLVMALLAAIAIPSYSSYVLRGHRSEGQALLSEAVARQERYFAQNNAYASSAAGLNMTTYVANLQYYTLGITSDGSSTYTLTATATGSQASDKACTTLSVNQAGTRSYTGTASSASDCWK
ncbi:MAG: Fimbrial protein [Pseudomonas citronellolis]|nr:MAG: Fimbrial protein [Pseudomonas citronellolis]